MFTAIKSGKTGLAEQRYVLQTQKFHSWWPWGSLRIVALVLLYIYGSTLAAPQAAAEVRRDVLDWLAIDTAPQQAKRIRTPLSASAPAARQEPATGNPADDPGPLERPAEQAGTPDAYKAQQ